MSKTDGCRVDVVPWGARLVLLVRYVSLDSCVINSYVIKYPHYTPMILPYFNAQTLLVLTISHYTSPIIPWNILHCFKSQWLMVKTLFHRSWLPKLAIDRNGSTTGSSRSDLSRCVWCQDSQYWIRVRCCAGIPRPHMIQLCRFLHSCKFFPVKNEYSRSCEPGLF
jgi:hypothetical protein